VRSLLAAMLFFGAPLHALAQTPNAPAAATAPAVAVGADRVMASPRPTAALSEWVDAPGRELVALEVSGATLRGWRYAGGDPTAPILILFGGNGFLIKNYDGLARQLAPYTSGVLAYDFRGYGFSTGEAKALTLREDGLVIFDAAAEMAGTPKKVVVWGNSMGSTIAAYIVARRPDAGGVVLVGAPSSAADALSLRPGLAPASDLVDFLGVAEQLTRSAVPLLIVHGSLDNQSLPAHARKNLESSAASEKALVMLEGVDHPSASRHPESVAAVRQFLAERSAPSAR
jgi:pimeloyl-ACP methyl ester carboxylesterase